MAIATVIIVLGISHAHVNAASAAPSQSDDPIGQPAADGYYVQSWALSPTGTDQAQPGSRAFLAYDLAPGASATDSVTLWNYSDVTLDFSVYATDAYSNRDGDFSVLPAARAARDAGTWITLATNSVTVPPKTKADIPMTISVPAGASPGDHAAGIVASVPTPTRNTDGSTTLVDRRTGTRVYVRVPGKVQQDLVVERLAVSYKANASPLDGTAVVEYTVRNGGNIRLSADRAIEIADPLGRVLARRTPRRLENLLPGASVALRDSFSGVPALMRLTATVRLEPVAAQGVSDEPLPAQEYRGHGWAIPWVVLALLAIAVLTWRFVRRNRQARRASGPRPSGTSAALG